MITISQLLPAIVLVRACVRGKEHSVPVSCLGRFTSTTTTAPEQPEVLSVWSTVNSTTKVSTVHMSVNVSSPSDSFSYQVKWRRMDNPGEPSYTRIGISNTFCLDGKLWSDRVVAPESSCDLDCCFAACDSLAGCTHVSWWHDNVCLLSSSDCE